MNAPIQYFGGKHYIRYDLIEMFPDHDTYVEVFGGGASVLCAKPPSAHEIYNDIDSGLVNFFRVIQNKELIEQEGGLLDRLSLTPRSREMYYDYRASWNDSDDPVEKAYRFFIVARQGFSGIFASSGWSVTKTKKGRRAWLNAIENLPQVADRLLNADIENIDFRHCLELYDAPGTLFYLDPPYVPSTRSDGEYQHEMTEADHVDLLKIITNGIQGKVILSGYDNELYEQHLGSWQKRDIKTKLWSEKVKGGKLQDRTETVWGNVPISDKQLSLFA